MARRELDDETAAVIVTALRAGHFLESAAALAGCTITQVRSWLRLGAEPDSRYADFADDVRRAIAQSEDKALEYLAVAASNGDLRAVTWWLERRHPQRWGQKVRHLVQQEIDGVLDRVEALSDELGEDTVARVLAAISGEAGGGEAEIEADADRH